MSGPGGPSVPPGQSHALPVAAWLAVFLLAIACALLWRAGNESDATPVKAPAVAPELPQKTRTSAEALLKELDRMTRRLDRPLNAVDRRLAEVSARLAVIDSLPRLLDQIGRNTQGFESLPRDLRALTREAQRVGNIRGSLNQVVSVLRRLRTATSTLTTLSGDITAIRRTFETVTASLQPLNELAQNVNAIVKQFRDAVDAVSGIRQTTERSFAQVVENLEAMRRDIQRIRECTERPAICSAPANR